MRYDSHAMCEACWLAVEAVRSPGAPGEPYRMRDPPTETCCFCGAPAVGGIYYRASDAEARHCRGH